MPNLHQQLETRATMPQTSTRSPMARVSDGLPERPYRYHGSGVDLLYDETMPDLGPDPEWYRERAEEQADFEGGYDGTIDGMLRRLIALIAAECARAGMLPS